MSVQTRPEGFICIRNTDRPGPRVYPVIKHPDGRIEEVTWAEYREVQALSLN